MLTSVQKALRVIDYLAENGPSGVSDIGRAINVTVGTAHRLVTTLVAAGYVVQHQDRRYALSSKIGELARRSQPARGLVEIARPELERLMSLSGETVNLGVFRENQVLYVDRVVTDQMLAITVRVGTRAPAFATALGRALLGYSDDEVREQYLNRLDALAVAADLTAPTVDRFRRLLRQVTSRGYSEEDGEFVAEVACFAAPVLDKSGHAVAAVSIAGRRSRIRSRKDELVPLVRSAAEDISKALQAAGAQVDL
jgi:DNA-binding IclR family transcriptional regulator